MDLLVLIVTKVRSAFCLFGLLLCCSLSAWAADGELSLTLVTSEYPPLTTQELPDGGILTRIVSETFAQAGIKVQFEYVPNNRSIQGVMLGLYDGSFGWAHAPDRDQKLLYSSNPIYTFRMVFFHRRINDYPWKSLADLHPFRIGGTLGDHYSDEFSELEAAGKLYVEYSSDYISNFKKLLRGRIDLFPMEETCGQFLLAEYFSPEEREQIVNQKNAFWTAPTYLVLKRNYPNGKKIIERFDRSFSQLVKSGRVAKIIEESLAQASKTLPEGKDSKLNR